jgi:hypothetical protein
MMIQTQRLEYQDHQEEITSLNRILADIQSSGDQPGLRATVEYIIDRLNRLMTTDKAVLKIYDQHEVHP